jgi:hypothetical protein
VADTDVLEDHTASIFKAEVSHGNGIKDKHLTENSL